MSDAVRITTGARLHFGLLDIAAPFGGCGVMIDQPSTIVEVERATEFAFLQNDVSVDHRERATAIARRIAASLTLEPPLPNVSVRITRSAPAHTGLGSGTQLSLAISEAILRAVGSIPSEASLQDARFSRLRDLWFDAADRGRRSAVGTHGYLHGGFIAEGIRRSDQRESLNPLDTRLELPPPWRVAIILPTGSPSATVATVSGEQEQTRFSSLPPVSEDRRDALSQLMMGSLIPAIAHVDFDAFCSAVATYNRSSGEFFSLVQGGPYNGEATTRLIRRLQTAGHVGVGQSSWGPGVFVWHPDQSAANDFQNQWQSETLRVIIARPQPEGRSVEEF